MKDKIKIATWRVIERIKQQPELQIEWNTMLNAEKNYFLGDIYNIIKEAVDESH